MIDYINDEQLALSTIAAIALLDKIKNIMCHVSSKRKRNMYNFASTIKLKHEDKILPRSKPKVLQRKTELSRYVLWNFAMTEKRFVAENCIICPPYTRIL